MSVITNIKSCFIAATVALLMLFVSNANGQESDKGLEFIKATSIENDTLFLDSNDIIMEIDTSDIEVIVVDSSKVFVPDPTKAVWYSALMPGAGQIYNRKYWKLPILVGGFMGLAYGISFNSRYFTDYSNAYRDAYSDDPNANSYINFLPYSYRNNKEWIENNKEWIRSSLKSKKDYYRRNRDLCIVSMLAVYGLAMIDAYVDAQLYTFDISPDVSMRLTPAVLEPTVKTPAVLGLQCSLVF